MRVRVCEIALPYLFLGIPVGKAHCGVAAPRTAAVPAQAGVEESPDTTGQRAS